MKDRRCGVRRMKPGVQVEAGLLHHLQVGAAVGEGPRAGRAAQAARHVVEQAKDHRDVARRPELGPVPASRPQEPAGLGQHARMVGGAGPTAARRGSSRRRAGRSSGNSCPSSCTEPSTKRWLGRATRRASARSDGCGSSPITAAVRDAAGHDGREVPGAAPQVEHGVVRPDRQRVEEAVVVDPVVAGVGGVERAVPRRQPGARVVAAAVSVDISFNETDSHSSDQRSSRWTTASSTGEKSR